MYSNYIASLSVDSNLNNLFVDLAKIIQAKSQKAFTNYSNNNSKNEIYKQWLKNAVSDATSKLTGYKTLLIKLLTIGGYQEADVREWPLQQLILNMQTFTDAYTDSFKKHNEYLQFTKILNSLRQFNKFAWEGYYYAKKDQFRISEDSLSLIKYFSQLKFQGVPSIRSNEFKQKHIIKSILQIISNLQTNGCSSNLLKEINKVEDDDIRKTLHQHAQFYNKNCINIMKQDTNFFYFLKELQKKQSSQQDIEVRFKQLDNEFQTTFCKLKDRFIQFLSKDKIPQKDLDCYQKNRQLQKELKQKDEELKLIQGQYAKILKKAIFYNQFYDKKTNIKKLSPNLPLETTPKKQNQNIQLLQTENKALKALLEYLKEKNQDFRKAIEEYDASDVKQGVAKNKYPQDLYNNYQYPKKYENSTQKSIQSAKQPGYKKEQKKSENLQSLETKISQFESTILQMQIQINQLNFLNKEKENKISSLVSEINALKNNIQKYKQEETRFKSSPVRIQVKQDIPLVKNKELDQLIESLNDSKAKNKQYLDQITLLKDTLKREKQKFATQIERITNEYNKNLSLYKNRQNGNSKKEELISLKSRLIQKMSSEIKQLIASLSAVQQTERRLRQQILFYSKQLQNNQKKIQSLNILVNSSPFEEDKHGAEENKKCQEIYQQKLQRLIQLNTKSLLSKEEKILTLNSRINELEAENHQLMTKKFVIYNSPRN